MIQLLPDCSAQIFPTTQDCFQLVQQCNGTFIYVGTVAQKMNIAIDYHSFQHAV